MATQNRPEAEVDVSADLVRALLADQHPDLADLDLVEFSSGWDNVIYRLGTQYSVRLPRREASAALVAHEQQALPELAPLLPVPVPAPVRIGQPGRGYPWSWSVIPWFDGGAAADADIADPAASASLLGAFAAALHQPAPGDAPPNPYRGHFVGQNDRVFRSRVEELGDALPKASSSVLGRWEELIDIGPWDGPPLWLHGDLHSANIVVHRGEISAVIDFGDVCAGDPANDLAVAWMLFDDAERDIFRAAAGDGGYEVDDAMWQRAEAWALHFAVTYFVHSADSPTMGRIGERLFAALIH